MESRVPHHIPGVSTSVMVQPLLNGYGRLQHPLSIFPIDQIKSSRVENDYIDCPAVVSRQPPSQKGARAPPDCLPRCEPRDVTHPWISFGGRPGSISSCSSGSTSSDQRLLDHAAPPPTAGPASGSPRLANPQAPKATGVVDGHTPHCRHCGRCRCTECTLPRTLPSCWVCNQECVCSAQTVVDGTTCMCLVKGVLYHCTDDEDDEGSCAERPCACSGSHCCVRWTFMASLSLVLPCLLCYAPATGCAKLSQKCYDRASRPGCRCKHPPVCKGTEEDGVGGGVDKRLS
ncbi:protein sprouty homolog 4-like [Paramormyrops kingsleyae]|uniref:protein sprouty homolog 4-like n=1 Tax=Paramormyrops kingsleyae TaxID=1676925 RepID=UPI003B96A396